MSEMIERVSDAIRRRYAEINFVDPGMDVPAEELARAVIEAMRTPTDGQRNAYYRLSYKTETMFDAHWERAIDAILYETPEDVA